MKKFTGYYEEIKINGSTYTVSIVKKGTGLNAIYYSYVTSENGNTREMSGFPVDQRQAKEPHVYTPEEIMDLAMFEAEDFIGDLDRHDQLDDMLFGFLAEVDENRRIAKELQEQN